MPKKNKKLENFYGSFTTEEAESLLWDFRRHFSKRNVKDSVIVSNVCYMIAHEKSTRTGDDRWTEDNVKGFLDNNMRLYKLFIDYVNDNVGVKYNMDKNRIHVFPEYWHFIRKESETDVLFREFGFPLFKEWSMILEAHTPAEVIFSGVGSSDQSPIVIKDEPFDPEAVDDFAVLTLGCKLEMEGPILPSKLTKL